MPMYPCNKCLERKWTYEMPDHLTVRATCGHCANEVEFPSRRAKKGKGMRHGSRKHKERPTHIGPAEALFNPAQIEDGGAPWKTE